jgi:hypothetical protein
MTGKKKLIITVIPCIILSNLITGATLVQHFPHLTVAIILLITDIIGILCIYFVNRIGE